MFQILTGSLVYSKQDKCVWVFHQTSYDFGRFRHGAMAIDAAVRRGIGIGTIARTYISDSREMCANHVAVALQSFYLGKDPFRVAS